MIGNCFCICLAFANHERPERLISLSVIQIPQPGWDKLFISFIPADSGKATAKTTKANVRSGACKWADPIYETTRLLQDVKTKQYDEKFYKLVVAMVGINGIVPSQFFSIRDKDSPDM